MAPWLAKEEKDEPYLVFRLSDAGERKRGVVKMTDAERCKYKRKFEETDGQEVVFQKSFGEKIHDMLQRSRQRLHRVFWVTLGCRSDVVQQILWDQLHGDSPVAPPGQSRHNIGQAADISKADAEGDIPIVLYEGRTYTFVEVGVIIALDEPEKAGIMAMLRKTNPGLFDECKDDSDFWDRIKELVGDGVLGMHDLVMEDGREAGLVGGFCGIPRDPWHYEEIEALEAEIEKLEARLKEESNSEKRKKLEGKIRVRNNKINCKRGDAWYTANKKALDEEPTKWVQVTIWTKKGIVIFKDALNTVIEKGGDAVKWLDEKGGVVWEKTKDAGKAIESWAEDLF